MSKFFKKFRQDQKGATAIEYGLIAALISIVIIAASQGIGRSLNTAFTTIDTTLDGAVNPQP